MYSKKQQQQQQQQQQQTKQIIFHLLVFVDNRYIEIELFTSEKRRELSKESK